VNLEKVEIETHVSQKSVGKILREARKAHRVRDLNIIARELCIKPHMLEALEEDNFGSFPSDCYATGFLKNYSNYLGLNTTDVVSTYIKEYAGSKECTVLSFPEAEHYRNISIRNIATIMMICIAIFFGVWGSMSKLNAKKITDSLLMSEESYEGKDVADLSENDNIFKQTFEKVTSSPLIASSPLIEPKDNALLIEENNITLQASNDVWVKIVKEDGLTLIDKILVKGEKFDAPKNPGLKLMTNNAAALTIMVGKNTLKSLGGEGEILNDITLEQENLLELSMLN
jgi:cytoskeleton protein RodZ